VHEVPESPQEWQGDQAEEDPLPTVHRRVMLTDLPESGLADIARRLKLTLPDPEPQPVRLAEPAPDREPEPERGSVPAGTAEPSGPAGSAAGAEPAFAAEAAVAPQIAPEPHPRSEGARPALAALPADEIDELARGLFARVVAGPPEDRGQPAATDELYNHLSVANVRRIDAFVYRVEVGRPVVVVRPSTAPEGARTLHRVVRTTDVWIGVPTATILNPPTELHEALYYAVD
jgi:hypothetical protein